ncbi:unnamed protein product [Phytophthora fragariaefolia]|uniref:Unnamed protein product n=1 Tax=Phytophthora fragariaefolia TaxID=1490495 RepID=A0A9W6XBM7_9STRA|nr:unnamed protein product [Phytophthora fragariaefolia]
MTPTRTDPALAGRHLVVHLDREPEDEEPRAQQREGGVRDGQHAAHDDGHRDDAHDAVHGGHDQQHAGPAHGAHDGHAALQELHSVAVRGAAGLAAQRRQRAGRPVVLDPRRERVPQEQGGVAAHEEPREQQEVEEEEDEQQAALVAPRAREAQRREQQHAAAQRRERRRAGAEARAQRQRQQRRAADETQQRQRAQQPAGRAHGLWLECLTREMGLWAWDATVSTDLAALFRAGSWIFPGRAGD